MKRIFLVLLFTGYVYAGFGQDPALQLPAVIGPSPDVASMQKYGDYKVSTYTGVPDITLPIYTIKLNDISVPITISYHAGGIKVDEESSRVGLGWTLSAGGTISRNILGLDDMKLVYSFAPNSFDLIGFPEKPVINQFSLPFAAHTYDISNKIGVTVDAAMPYIDVDLEPDIFYCNFLGNSEKFILRKSDTSGVFEDKSSNSKVKFTVSGYYDHDGTIASEVGMNCFITFTTSDGTVYSFNQFESCKTVSPAEDIPARITAWYLTKIQTVKGTVVNFNYEVNNSGYTYSLNKPSVTKNLLPSTGDPTEPVPGLVPHNIYRNLLLTSITAPNCNVYFDYDTRIDLNGDKRLTDVRVADGKGTLVKIVDLIQDYFTANSSSANTYDLQPALWGGPAPDPNWLSKRLKLTELREVSADGQTTLSHKFDYNETLLPLKNSTSRDHWGFFNNAANGANILPDIAWRYPGLQKVSVPGVYVCNPPTNDFGYQNAVYQEIPQTYYYHYAGANREVDTNYSQAFQLKRITYPTGGFTEFNFEQNTYDKDRSFINDHNASLYGVIVPPSYNTTIDTFAFIPGVLGFPSGFSKTDNFSVTADNTDPFDFAITGMRSGSSNSTSTTNTVVSILNSSNAVVDQISFNSYTGMTDNGDGTYSIHHPSVQLPAGSYTVKIVFGANVVDRNSQVYVITGTWKRLIIPSIDGPHYLYSGGLRVKNVSGYTSAGNLANSIDYTYHYLTDSNHNNIPEVYSTGKIMERPNYMEGNFQVTPFKLYLRSESDAGVNIGYDSVIIEQNRSRRLDAYNNNPYRPNPYKTYYTVSSSTEMMPSGLGLAIVGGMSLDMFFDSKPAGIKNFFDNANGHLTKSVDYRYDSSTASYKILKQTDYTWTYSSGTGTEGIVWADRLLPSSNGIFYNCLSGFPPMYGVTSYFYPAMRSVAVLPLQTKETVYTATNSMVTVTTNAYTIHNQLMSATVANSKGQTVTDNYIYPLDCTGAAAGTDAFSMGVAALQSKNIVAPAIEHYVQKKSADGSLIGTVKSMLTSYSARNSLPDAVWSTEFTQPSTGFTPLNTSGGSLVKDNSYLPQLLFNKYDIAGNISEQQKANDLKTVYLWDYTNSYPVCQVVNADSADIAYTSFEADGSGSWAIGPGTVSAAGGLTGTNYYTLSSGAAISRSGLNTAKQYYVTYWSKNGPLTIAGTTAVAGLVKMGWTFYQHILPAGGASVSITGAGVSVDELRLYPVGAQMSTYTYVPLIGQSSVCSVNNTVSYYEYDGLGRLKDVRDQDGNVIKTYEYHYRQQ